jgi:hypothetical protein
MRLSPEANAAQAVPSQSRFVAVRPARWPLVRFALHYGEMVAVMFVGMGVFAGALAVAGAALGFGLDDVESGAPASFLAGMGVSMTVPMVAWMRFRGHSAAANRAMAISMIAPTVAVLALLAAGFVSDSGTLLEIQHIAMFPGMLAAMLLHRSEYTHRAH